MREGGRNNAKFKVGSRAHCNFLWMKDTGIVPAANVCGKISKWIDRFFDISFNTQLPITRLKICAVSNLAPMWKASFSSLGAPSSDLLAVLARLGIGASLVERNSALMPKPSSPPPSCVALSIVLRCFFFSRNLKSKSTVPPQPTDRISCASRHSC